MPASSIRHQLFIDGRFVDAESGETLATLNPHDNTPIVDVAPRQGRRRQGRGRREARVPGVEPHGRPPTAAASCSGSPT